LCFLQQKLGYADAVLVKPGLAITQVKPPDADKGIVEAEFVYGVERVFKTMTPPAQGFGVVGPKSSRSQVCKPAGQPGAGTCRLGSMPPGKMKA
jgi:hypothetical protein